MSKLFPIGDIANGQAYGTMEDSNAIQYSLFEPNANCSSSKIYSTLIAAFEDQTRQVRKKAEPYLRIAYEYSGIYTKEYRQIANFVEEIDDALTSFYVIDWSMGMTPTGVTSGWVVSIPETRLYSTYEGKGAYRALLWDGVNWKLGTVASISENTNIDLTTSEGALSYVDANTDGMVYPVYECYITPNSLQSFKVENFIPGYSVGINNEGGYTYSGEIGFITKYKV